MSALKYIYEFYVLRCLNCGKIWISRKVPLTCPRCRRSRSVNIVGKIEVEVDGSDTRVRILGE